MVLISNKTNELFTVVRYNIMLGSRNTIQFFDALTQQLFDYFPKKLLTIATATFFF